MRLNKNGQAAELVLGILAIAFITLVAGGLLWGCPLTGWDEGRLKLEQERTKQMTLSNDGADKQREFERHKFDERVRLCEKFVTEHHIPGDRSGISCGLGQ